MYYEQIKAEVVKVCPEIMELKFGCEVRVQNYAMSITLIQDRRGNTWIPENGEPNTDFSGFAGSIMYFDEKHITEILGSPIELHHILRTIDSNDCVVNWKLETNTHLGGLTIITFDGNSETEYKIPYDLALPLALQSEETLKGLSELLSGNNK